MVLTVCGCHSVKVAVQRWTGYVFYCHLCVCVCVCQHLPLCLAHLVTQGPHAGTYESVIKVTRLGSDHLKSNVRSLLASQNNATGSSALENNATVSGGWCGNGNRIKVGSPQWAQLGHSKGTTFTAERKVPKDDALVVGWGESTFGAKPISYKSCLVKMEFGHEHLEIDFGLKVYKEVQGLTWNTVGLLKTVSK